MHLSATSANSPKSGREKVPPNRPISLTISGVYNRSLQVWATEDQITVQPVTIDISKQYAFSHQHDLPPSSTLAHLRHTKKTYPPPGASTIGRKKTQQQKNKHL